MTDRELLEAAADAAGFPVNFDEGDVNGFWPMGVMEDGNVAWWWNPLTDDGDALRLAVKLEMQVCIGLRRIDAVIVRDEDGGVVRGTESKQGDFYAATRRAIVSAAAAIGARESARLGGRGETA